MPVLPEVAFLGRSNVGKSSLINALTGSRGLARVSKTPGKTRACTVFDVDGRWYLVDLPGYGYARAAAADRAGFRHLLDTYVSGRRTLAGAVWLLDIRRDPSPDDLDMGARLSARGVPVLAAVTKADKLPWGRRRARLLAILAQVGLPDDQAIPTSIRSGEGIADLRASLAALVEGAGRPGDGTAA